MFNAFSANELVWPALPSVRRCAATLGYGVKRLRRNLRQEVSRFASRATPTDTVTA